MIQHTVYLSLTHKFGELNLPAGSCWVLPAVSGDSSQNQSKERRTKEVSMIKKSMISLLLMCNPAGPNAKQPSAFSKRQPALLKTMR